MTDELTPLTGWAQANRETLYAWPSSAEPRNAPWPSNREMRAMLDALYARNAVPKPTMTLAQWDERRAAFRALEGKK